MRRIGNVLSAANIEQRLPREGRYARRRRGAAVNLAVRDAQDFPIAIASHRPSATIAADIKGAVVQRQAPPFITRCRTTNADEPSGSTVAETDALDAQLRRIRTGEQVTVGARGRQAIGSAHV